MGVVEIEAVAERAVQEGGAGRRIARGIAEHAGIAGGEAEGAGGGEQGRGAFRVVAGADDVADQVEHEEARAVDDVGRAGGRARSPR